MIGILIIAHDTLPDSLVKAVTHVLGTRPPQFETVSVSASDDPFHLLPTAKEAECSTPSFQGRIGVPLSKVGLS